MKQSNNPDDFPLQKKASGNIEPKKPEFQEKKINSRKSSKRSLLSQKSQKRPLSTKNNRVLIGQNIQTEPMQPMYRQRSIEIPDIQPLRNQINSIEEKIENFRNLNNQEIPDLQPLKNRVSSIEIEFDDLKSSLADLKLNQAQKEKNFSTKFEEELESLRLFKQKVEIVRPFKPLKPYRKQKL